MLALGHNHKACLWLQAANVHAILESGPVVAGVVDRLDGAISLIDDLDENLNIFDVKLRHMREVSCHSICKP